MLTDNLRRVYSDSQLGDSHASRRSSCPIAPMHVLSSLCPSESVQDPRQRTALPAFRLDLPTLLNPIKMTPLGHCHRLISEDPRFCQVDNTIHRGRCSWVLLVSGLTFSSSFHRVERFPSDGPPLRPLPSGNSLLPVMPGATGSSCGRSCPLGNGHTGT